MRVAGLQGPGGIDCVAPAAKLRRVALVGRADDWDATTRETVRRRTEVAEPDRSHLPHALFEILYLNIVIVYRGATRVKTLTAKSAASNYPVRDEFSAQARRCGYR